MQKEVNNGDVFEASIHFPNSTKSKNDVIVLVNKASGLYRSTINGEYYNHNQINFANIAAVDRTRHKKNISFTYFSIKGKSTYIITITNRNNQFLGFIKWHGYAYKEIREANTMFDYSCSKDVTSILRDLLEERRSRK